MPKLEHKLIPLQIKAVNVEESTFEGFSAGIGNLDDGNDRVMQGAFDKTIRERVETGKVKFLDHHAAKNPFMQSSDRLWGTVIEAEEHKLTPTERKELAKRAGRPTKDAPSHALLSLTKVSKAQPAQDALVKIAEGILDALSIGYIPTADKVKYVPFKVAKKKGGKKDTDGEGDGDSTIDEIRQTDGVLAAAQGLDVGRAAGRILGERFAIDQDLDPADLRLERLGGRDGADQGHRQERQ